MVYKRDKIGRFASKGGSTSLTTSDSTKKTTLTDDEIRAKITRLELEKKYRDLSATVSPPKSKKGRDFVMRVLEKSGENIATQTVTALMGKAVNKTIGSMLGDIDLVNPKKGQKDK